MCHGFESCTPHQRKQIFVKEGADRTASVSRRKASFRSASCRWRPVVKRCARRGRVGHHHLGCVHHRSRHPSVPRRERVRMAAAEPIPASPTGALQTAAASGEKSGRRVACVPSQSPQGMQSGYAKPADGLCIRFELPRLPPVVRRVCRQEGLRMVLGSRAAIPSMPSQPRALDPHRLHLDELADVVSGISGSERHPSVEAWDGA